MRVNLNSVPGELTPVHVYQLKSDAAFVAMLEGEELARNADAVELLAAIKAAGHYVIDVVNDPQQPKDIELPAPE